MPELNLNDVPKTSAIKTHRLNNFLSSLFGWNKNAKSKNKIDFVSVDLKSDQHIGQSLLNTKVSNTPMGEHLEKLFNNWMNDTTDKCAEIQERKNRVDQLSYAVLNEPTLNRIVKLYADEATQLDQQNTILNIETPDPKMTEDMYNLLNQWGITQTRIRATIEQIATYGDAFWANKVSDKGVERIIPLKQLQVSDRLEFNPVEALERMKRKDGSFYTYASKNYLIDKMLDSLGTTDDFASMFDTKLFGFSILEDLVVPPWTITHFRLDADSSQFYPFGTSPILGTLSPFKQVQSTIALQSLSRMMSFPIQVYSVKTNDSMDEGRQFGVVNRVREAYDNIGVTPGMGASEVYTVNTKIWVPEGLLKVETHKSEVNSGDVEDLKIYQNRLAIAAGVPKGFFGEEGFMSGEYSGKSLIQQYKPFGRQVYSIQSAFLESLADLFRTHFAITGQYDFRVPFTISMKYPIVEDTEIDAKTTTMELASKVLELIKLAVGAGEEDLLPPDIIRDVLGKYTFLDPADIVRWTRDAKYSVDLANIASFDFTAGDSGMETGGMDTPGDIGEDLGDMGEESMDLGGGETSTESIPVEESQQETAKRLREMKFREKYFSKKGDIYFESLKCCAVNDFNRGSNHVHVCNIVNPQIELMLETLSEENGRKRFKESFYYNKPFETEENFTKNS